MPAMTHRQMLEAMSGLMLGMFVAILSSTVVSTSLPRIVSDLGGSQSSLHLGRHLHPAGADRQHADLGQARRPLRPQAARPDRPGHLRGRVDPRRALAVDGLADRLSRDPGHRRRRPHRAGAGDPRPTSSRRVSAAATPATSAPCSASAPSPARCSAASSPTRSAGAGASTSASRSRSPRSSSCSRRCTSRAAGARSSIDYAGVGADRRRRVERC